MQTEMARAALSSAPNRAEILSIQREKRERERSDGRRPTPAASERSQEQRQDERKDRNISLWVYCVDGSSS